LPLLNNSSILHGYFSITMYICKLNFINDLDQGDTYSEFLKRKH